MVMVGAKLKTLLNWINQLISPQDGPFIFIQFKYCIPDD